jgi:IrrE N-terminal-like domain
MPVGRPIEAEIIAASLSGPWEPPVNLVLVAQEIGVVDIRQTERRDGYTDFRRAAPVIYVNGLASRTRQRFILAHELAHVMLRKPEVVSLIKRRGQLELLDNEESLANRVGAALLVPDSWVDAMKDADLGLADLESVARQAGIPVKNLIARLAAADMDVALLHWQRGRDAWHLVDRPGVPESLRGRVELSPRGRMAIERLGGRESRVVLDCHAAGRTLRISGSGSRRGRNGHDALQLIRPTRDIEYPPDAAAPRPADRTRVRDQARRSDPRRREETGQAPRGTAGEANPSAVGGADFCLA